MIEIKGIAYYLLLLIVLLSIIFHTLQIADGHQWGDFALYLLQSKAIVNNAMEELLGLNTYSIENSHFPTGPHLYPWGFPLLLAPIYYFFGFNIYVFKVYLILIFGMILMTIFYLFKNKLGSFSSLLLVVIFAFNPLFIAYTNLIQSDLPFLLFSLLAVFFIQRIIIEGKNGHISFGMGLLVGAMIFFSYFIRSNGIVFLPVLFVCQLIKKFDHFGTWKSLANFRNYNVNFFFPYLSFFILVIIANGIFPEGSNSHFDRFKKVNSELIIENIIYYIKLPSVFFLSGIISKIVYYITIPLFLVGLVKNFKKDYLYILFSIVSIAVCILWPYTKGIRFIFPILPFYFYFLFKGLSEFDRIFLPTIKLIKIRSEYIFSATLIVLFLTACTIRILKEKELEFDGPYSTNATEMFSFISNNTTKSDLIIFRKPRSMMLCADRVSIWENRTGPIKSFPNSYIVVDKMYCNIDIASEKFDLKELQKMPLVYKNNRFEVFSVKKDFKKQADRK